MISIVTVCHRSYELLTAYVDSFLVHHKDGGDIEFVLVENSSDERTEEHAEKLRANGFQAQVTYTANDGFGAGCNRGVELASGDILAFVNPDLEFKTPLSGLPSGLQDTRWGTIRQISGKGQVLAFNLLPERTSMLTELLFIHRYLHNFLGLVGRHVFPAGSFFVCETELFKQVGGFDERFFLYFEEAELARRLHTAAGPPGYCSDIEIYHAGLGTQESSDAALRHELNGLKTYCEVTNQPEVFARRQSILRRLAPLSKGAALRASLMEIERPDAV